MMTFALPRLDRAVLQSPDAIARAAASRTRDPEKRWLLRQARAVRTSYAREVLDRAGEPHADEIWMLRQAKPVRESYIRDVLGAGQAAQQPRRPPA